MPCSFARLAFVNARLPSGTRPCGHGGEQRRAGQHCQSERCDRHNNSSGNTFSKIVGLHHGGVGFFVFFVSQSNTFTLNLVALVSSWTHRRQPIRGTNPIRLVIDHGSEFREKPARGALAWAGSSTHRAGRITLGGRTSLICDLLGSFLGTCRPSVRHRASRRFIRELSRYCGISAWIPARTKCLVRALTEDEPDVQGLYASRDVILRSLSGRRRLRAPSD
jgi:hypothetical protein